ncbi:hypothetical protein DVK85_13370 [Flavobacterium arcticum]|uniref:Signal peptidase n=1 Tax=Flavobacterium arcticum TaxID=1784713 RepID=A0A345HF03_9FLAO|nr:hypothetical protein [Flavobacterium arcticum]AXG75163.1 hypothetical protein DVK85_13370 [Flavobacterium arcticum]KAF2511055.1 hypothetical protein E0W72_06575 [Flavobacterium arcticum]
MRKLFLNLYVFIFLIASDYTLFAQPSDQDGTGDGDGGVEDGGDPVAPINGKIIVLAIVAISFAYYYFSKRREEKQLTSN